MIPVEGSAFAFPDVYSQVILLICMFFNKLFLILYCLGYGFQLFKGVGKIEIGN